ncbi:MAG: exodeoxyribonuclease III, partial [Burkholderiales bacterium]
MKVISINVNGIRSAHNKGLFAWLEAQDADIICLQEIKAHLDDIPKELLNWNGYFSQFHPAAKKGYSGVAIYAKQPPQQIVVGLNNPEIDTEGRYLQFDYADFSVISLYLPSGSSGPERQEKKFRFMEYYTPILYHKLQAKKEYLICGDWNIAHQEIDLKNWQGNKKNSGFLPEERAWISQLLARGFVDGWRSLYPNQPGYTWWSNRGQ